MVMSEEKYKAVEVLEWVISTRGGTYPSIGLCDWVKEYLSHDTLYTLFKAWPEFSGDLTFPVPSGSKRKTPSQAYILGMNKYKGAYGKARLRLAQFIVDELKKGTV